MQNRSTSEPPAGSPERPDALRISRFLPGAAAVGAAVFGVGLALSTLVPHVYESAALLTVKSSGGVTSLPQDLPTMVLRLATNGTVLRALAHRLGEADASDAVLAKARGLAAVTELPGGGFRVSFRAPTSDGAQRGCEDMTSSIVAGVPALGGGAEQARGEELARRTRELALFVTAHPDLAGDSPAPSSSAQKAETKSAPATDPTLMVLRDERKRLETELASRAAAPAPSSVFGPNPYDDPVESAETEKLQRRLGELRLAIAAHQKALLDRAASPSAQPVVSPVGNGALEAQWKKLVQSVVEAQQAAGRTSAPTLSATVVEAPSLPDAPLSPSRVIVFLLSAGAGVWAALTFALFRFKTSGRPQTRRARPGESGRPPVDDKRSFAGATVRVPALAAGGSGSGTMSAVAAKPGTSGSGARPAVTDKIGTPEPTGSLPLDRTVAVPQTEPVKPQVTTAVVVPSPNASTSALAATVAVDVSGMPAPQKRSDPPPAGRAPSNPPQRRSSNPPPLPANDPSRRVEAQKPETVSKSDPPRATQKSEPPRPTQKSDPPRPTQKSEPPRPTMKSEPPRPRSDPPRPTMKSEPPRPSLRTEVSPGATQVGNVPRETVRPPKPSTPPPPVGPWPTQEEVQRPSQVPGPRRTLSPPPLEASPASRAPDTRRMGGSDPVRAAATMPHGSVPERPDTTYSIVDRSRRSSRKPEPGPGDRKLSARGTRPLSTDLGVLRPGSDPPPGVTGYETRPPPGPRGGTRPGWAIPGAEPATAPTELVRRESRTPPPGAELVQARSVPPSWRPPPPVEGPLGEVGELRDQLLARMNGRCFVLGVVSAQDSLASKTALAMRLSLMLAEAGAKVLTMEANFDFPAVGRAFGVEMPRLAGFSQQLHARIRTGEKPPWTVVRCSPNLHILAEGFMRSPGVALSREFADAITDLRAAYDFIIADGPTAGAGADSKPLNAYADGLVVAVRPGQSLQEAIERAAQWFSRKDLMAAVTFDAT